MSERWSNNGKVVRDENRLKVCTATNRGDARLIAKAPRMRDDLRALLAAGQLVLSRWERGDLAEAVRALQAAVDQAVQS